MMSEGAAFIAAGIFSPKAEVLGGPPPRPLPTLRVAVEDEDIWVEGWSAGQLCPFVGSKTNV